MVERLENNEEQKMWNEEPNFGYYICVCLQGLRKPQNVGQSSRSTNGDLNPQPPE
jgi:hypothetical protein